jgi:hypothetical protein
VQRLDVTPRCGDRFRAIEDRQPRSVVPRLAMREERELAARLGELAPEHVVGRGLDAEHIEPRLQALPLDQAGQRRPVVVEPDAEAAVAEPRVDHRCRRHAVRRRDQVVLVDLLAEVGIRRTLDPIAGALGAQVLMHRMDDRPARQQQLGTLVEQGKTEVVVVEQHVRGRARAAVLDPVGHADRGAAERRLDPPGQHQALAEHRHLRDLALGEQGAGVAVPALAQAATQSAAINVGGNFEMMSRGNTSGVNKWGKVAYQLAYDRALSAIEIEQNRQALKSILAGRGITLP